MASPSPAIPDRTSSLKADISKRRSMLKESKADLKRRLSEVSFETSPLEHTKLRMDHLEAEVEGDDWIPCRMAKAAWDQLVWDALSPRSGWNVVRIRRRRLGFGLICIACILV